MDIGTFYKQKIYPNLYAIEQKMTRIPNPIVRFETS